MEAKELRIGNLIYYGQQINDIDINDLSELNYSYGKSNIYKPIPLTEEWLLKFGFNKPSHSFICERFHITKQDNSNYWFTAFNKNNAMITKLKHVHQLQNLYFALTEKELTIK